MAKFPSQRKIMYAGAAVSNGNFALTHNICVPKDLSMLNFRGYASTNRKGVPLIYRVAATVYPTGLDGSGYTTSVSSDVRTTVKFLGCQNNWVTRNAAVKWQAARNAMLKAAGIKKKDLGAYAHEIRYELEAVDTTWAVPVDGDGAALAGGTWDSTKFVNEADPEFGLKLIGPGNDEDSAINTSVINFAYSYLSSRQTVPADSNLESAETPAVNSILKQMFLSGTGVDRAEQSYIETDVKGQGDNPPYDHFATADTDHDITEPVELGRAVLMPQGSGATLPQTVVLDIPFGIMKVQMAHRDPGDNSGITDDLALGLEVLDIFEMQG